MGSIRKWLQMLPVEIMLLSPFWQNEGIKFPDPVYGMYAAAPVQNSCGQSNIEFNFPKLLRILPDGFELGIGFGMLLFQAGIRNFRNEKSWIPVALWSSY